MPRSRPRPRAGDDDANPRRSLTTDRECAAIAISGESTWRLNPAMFMIALYSDESASAHAARYFSCEP